MIQMKNIDARGKACPIPVIMAKKEADKGIESFSVTVDNPTALENLSRFGINGGFTVKTKEISEEEFLVRFSKDNVKAEVNMKETEASENPANSMGLENSIGLVAREVREKTWAVFIGGKGIGKGDEEFSQVLMNMYLYTLSESDDWPKYILFMNQGVSIPTENEEAAEHLKKLKEKGSKILVCGACLNFYGLEGQLKVGEVSNMYVINEAMVEVDNLISL